MEYLLVLIFKLNGEAPLVVKERFGTAEECRIAQESLIKDINGNKYSNISSIISKSCYKVTKK